jgi:multidrug efflux pump subunit AcrB
VFTSVFTTIVAFTPFFFLDGVMGKFIWHMALVVISALLFSLIEAFFILPAHLAHSKGLQSHKKDSKLRKKIEKFIHILTHKIYAPLLRSAMNHKWITVIAPTAFILLTIGLIKGGFIGLTFFPIIDGDTIPVNLTLVAGRQEKDVDEILAKIEKACWQVNEEMKKERPDKKDLILGIKRVIGSNDLKEQGSHVGKLKLQLLDGEARMMDTEIISNRIRDVVGPIPEAQNITFGRVSMFGKPVSISLLGTEPDQLRKARDLLVAELKEFDALKDVVDTEQEGRREIDIRLKPRADAMGLKLQDVIGQVRQGFFGQQIQRIQRGRDEIRVWVRYSDKDRASLTLLDQMRIRTPQGEYPFSELAYYKVRRGVTRINHLNRRREITVEASLSSEDVDLPPILNEIQTEVVPKILSRVNNVQALFEGQSREQKKITTSVITAFPIAMVVMFIMIVLVFRSVAQAGLVISLIPLGIMGAIWGHGIRGIQLNMLSLYGIIALTGIVVNDSIVLVDQVNRNLRLGQKFFDAVYNAGISRLRPILLTTLTTSIGLAPILIEKSRQAQFLIPMAVSVAFGLLFGTFILLLILPAGLLVLNRVRMVWAGFFTSELLTPESVEPAVRELKESAVEL